MKLKKLAAVLCAALMLVSGTSCGLLDKLFGGGETAEKADPYAGKLDRYGKR